MELVLLDNEVFFRKAFTDRIVFIAFVKDILGITIDPDTIKTEKAFHPKIGNIKFKYDVFAEDTKNRIIVEIQRVEYDHNFDRFLHYHYQAVTEQQRSSEDYTINKTVYTIVIMTEPYKVVDKTGEVIRDEVLISVTNPRNLKGKIIPIYNHELIFLNPNYPDPATPKKIRDWLDLIYQSIHHPNNPNINLDNPAINRAARLVEWENINPEEWAASKFAAANRTVIKLAEDEGVKKGIELEKVESANIAIDEGFSNEQIAKITRLSIEKIQELRDLRK